MSIDVTYSKNQRVCASCRYWGGKREIDFVGNFYKAKESRGICFGPAGAFQRVNMSAGGSCNEWEAFRDRK